MWSAASRTLLASVVSLVVVACSDDPSAPVAKQTGTSSASSADSADLCVTTINEYRATKGLPPYARWTDAETCTDGESQSDATSGKSHGSFGKCGEFAQNECPGWPAPATKMIPSCLKAMWAEGPGGGHYEAMASTKYTKVACGFGTAQDSSIWSAQNFR